MAVHLIRYSFGYWPWTSGSNHSFLSFPHPQPIPSSLDTGSGFISPPCDHKAGNRGYTCTQSSTLSVSFSHTVTDDGVVSNGLFPGIVVVWLHTGHFPTCTDPLWSAYKHTRTQTYAISYSCSLFLVHTYPLPRQPNSLLSLCLTHTDRHAHTCCTHIKSFYHLPFSNHTHTLLLSSF